MTPSVRRFGVTAVCLGALLAGGGVALALDRSATSPPVSVPLTDVGRVPAGATAGAGTDQPRAPEASSRNRGPATLPRDAQLRIGAVTARIGRVRVADHEMQIPLDPRRVGWWRASAVPGSAAGSVVIVGHVNYAGVTGALAVLPHLRPGDPVTITAAHRRVRYVVAGVRSYPKSTGLPGQVFAVSGPARLVLITCGGPFDSASGNYEDNVVAYAVPRA